MSRTIYFKGEPVDRDLTHLVRVGYHFCEECEQVTNLTGDEAHQVCQLCHGKKVKWHPPVMPDWELLRPVKKNL